MPVMPKGTKRSPGCMWRRVRGNLMSDASREAQSAVRQGS